MKKFINLFFFLAVAATVFSCSKDDDDKTPTTTEKNKILVNYPWKMTTVTDLSGKTIPNNQLNTQTQYIPELEIQFQTGNKVFAKDAAKQVQNGGTWQLVESETVLNIDIIGFAGEFGVEELTSSRMKLKSVMPVNGVDQETIMVFAPVIN